MEHLLYALISVDSLDLKLRFERGYQVLHEYLPQCQLLPVIGVFACDILGHKMKQFLDNPR